MTQRREKKHLSADLGLRNLPTIREWIGYPLVRVFNPTVFIADFTYASEEGTVKDGIRILASFVAT